MKPFHTALALSLFLSAAAQADDGPHHASGMKDHAVSSAKATATGTQAHRGQGTVNSVDAATGKVNLTHEPIESLGWKSMTMGFAVQDPALIKNLKPGAQVTFELQKNGASYLITQIAPMEAPSTTSSSKEDDPAHPPTH